LGHEKEDRARKVIGKGRIKEESFLGDVEEIIADIPWLLSRWEGKKGKKN